MRLLAALVLALVAQAEALPPAYDDEGVGATSRVTMFELK